MVVRKDESHHSIGEENSAFESAFEECNNNSISVEVGKTSPHNEALLLLHRVLEEGKDIPINLNKFDTPIWYDPVKFKKGQKLFYKNFFAMFVSKLSGLLIILNIPTALKILILSGKSSTPSKAYRRYMNTISSMISWYKGDLGDKDNKIFKVLLSVRAKHQSAARKSQLAGEGTITQKDLALTQFGFMGLALVYREYFGIQGTAGEIEGFVHFWRTIGYFMGIEDRFNICSGSLLAVTETCRILAQDHFKPLLSANPTHDFVSMSHALLDGLRPLVPLMRKDAFMEFILRHLLQIESPSRLGWYGKLILYVQIFSHRVLLRYWWLAFVMRPSMNAMLRLSVYANCVKYPLLAMCFYGRQACKSSDHADTNANAACAFSQSDSGNRTEEPKKDEETDKNP